MYYTGEFTSTIDEATEIPVLDKKVGFALCQNYPNPFNQSTRIDYILPVESRVTLKVFDLLGRELDILVNEDELPGIKSAEWNPVGLPEGVYLYRLQANPCNPAELPFTASKKLFIIK